MTETSKEIIDGDVKKCLMYIIALLSGLEVSVSILPGHGPDVNDLTQNLMQKMMGIEAIQTYRMFLRKGEPRVYRKLQLQVLSTEETREGYVEEDISFLKVLSLAKNLTDEQVAELEKRLEEAKKKGQDEA